MPEILANDFTEITATLSQNAALHNAVIALIASQPMAGKVTEGGNRLDLFRNILSDLVNGNTSLDAASHKTQDELSPQTSLYASNNRVFPSGWAERLVRTQLSRFYNQAVMEKLLAEGETQCFVPHSAAEDSGSSCSLQLAGSNQDLKTLHNRLVDAYEKGIWSQTVKIPNHPHCTHVVTRAR